MVGKKPTTRERIGNDIDTLFDKMEETRGTPYEAEYAFYVTQVGTESNYTDEAVQEQVAAFTDAVTIPLISHVHGERERPAYDADAWRQKLADIPGENRGVKIPPSDERMSNLYDAVKDEYRPDAFDYVVAPFSAGVGPLGAVSDYLSSADDVIIRYSKNRGDGRDDVDILVGPSNMTPDDLAGSDVLVVDDGIELGRTFERVGDWLWNQDTDSIEYIATQASNRWWPVQDPYEPITHREMKEWRAQQPEELEEHYAVKLLRYDGNKYAPDHPPADFEPVPDAE